MESPQNQRATKVSMKRGHRGEKGLKGQRLDGNVKLGRRSKARPGRRK